MGALEVKGERPCFLMHLGLRRIFYWWDVGVYSQASVADQGAHSHIVAPVPTLEALVGLGSSHLVMEEQLTWDQPSHKRKTNRNSG